MPSRKAKAAVARRSLNTQPKLSPLLRSAFEVLEHGLWHFFRSDTTTDMKFALLHLDQAVELLLKERVRAGGKSIYKNPKETIGIWGAYEILTKELGCTIPEKPDLELLHEERNSIQHKYSNPSADDAAFHVEHALRFIRRFLKEELDLDIANFVSAEFLEDLGFLPQPNVQPGVSPELPPDPVNRGWVLGWGVYRARPWHLAGVFASQIEADKIRADAGDEYVAAYGSHRLGSDDFLEGSSQAG